MEQARQTVVEMFEQRGYDILEVEDVQIMAVKPNGEHVCAFLGIQQYNSDSARDIIHTMNELEINHALVVYAETATANAKKIIKDLDGMTIETFAEEELKYNITKHRYQPIFEVLSSEEAEKFKKKYGTKFGTIQRSDPIARFYNYERGDVIKITRCYQFKHGKLSRGDPEDGYIDYRIVRGQ